MVAKLQAGQRRTPVSISGMGKILVFLFLSSSKVQPCSWPHASSHLTDTRDTHLFLASQLVFSEKFSQQYRPCIHWFHPNHTPSHLLAQKFTKFVHFLSLDTFPKSHNPAILETKLLFLPKGNFTITEILCLNTKKMKCHQTDASHGYRHNILDYPYIVT